MLGAMIMHALVVACMGRGVSVRGRRVQQCAHVIVTLCEGLHDLHQLRLLMRTAPVPSCGREPACAAATCQCGRVDAVDCQRRPRTEAGVVPAVMGAFDLSHGHGMRGWVSGGILAVSWLQDRGADQT